MKINIQIITLNFAITPHKNLATEFMSLTFLLDFHRLQSTKLIVFYPNYGNNTSAIVYECYLCSQENYLKKIR